MEGQHAVFSVSGVEDGNARGVERQAHGFFHRLGRLGVGTAGERATYSEGGGGQDG